MIQALEQRSTLNYPYRDSCKFPVLSVKGFMGGTYKAGSSYFS